VLSNLRIRGNDVIFVYLVTLCRFQGLLVKYVRRIAVAEVEDKNDKVVWPHFPQTRLCILSGQSDYRLNTSDLSVLVVL
jgi:hypothetical protein